jgi:hypothetical protein
MNDETFEQGQSEADRGGPVIAQETLGAPTGITARRPNRPVVQLSEPYLMPPITRRTSAGELRDNPGIVHTPLGGLMPGPNAIAPALPVHGVGAAQAFDCNEDGGFKSGVIDAWPEGPPVPLR